MNTTNRLLLTLAAATALIAPIFAQNAERRATFRGGGGNDTGKCTIEVQVDGSAEVEIHGDRALLRTSSGRQAQFRRFECTGPMPTSPGDFRFSGVDGRGRQELVQDPRSGHGAAIVRIEDRDGGVEGYTFDLEWRGAGSSRGPEGQPLGGGMDWRVSPNDAVRACQDAVRARARQQYGFSEIDFRGLNADDNPGRNDTIMGSFGVRRGAYRDAYRFSCAVDLANGRIRGVDISQDPGAGSADRYAVRDRTTSACQLAAEQRMRRDGYRNVQFGWRGADNRWNDGIAGTATAQRGNNGRAYDFDIRCSVNRADGNVRSVQLTRR